METHFVMPATEPIMAMFVDNSVPANSIASSCSCDVKQGDIQILQPLDVFFGEKGHGLN